jgi:hypothetical protein
MTYRFLRHSVHEPQLPAANVHDALFL